MKIVPKGDVRMGSPMNYKDANHSTKRNIVLNHILI